MISRNSVVALFSGGGTRFAIYCGMFAAMEDAGIKPDLIIASCGGSLATTIINSFDNNIQRKAYLISNELFNFINSFRITQASNLTNIGWYSLKKIMVKKNAPYIEDVFNNYLVISPDDFLTACPSLSPHFNNHIKSIFIGSKILFKQDEVNKPRSGKVLYRKVLFTDSDTAALIDTQNNSLHSQCYKNSAVCSNTSIITDIPAPIAARISISDMFYTQPFLYQDESFLGGAIDLLPVELATQFGGRIFMERKQPYSVVEEAFVRAVYGFSGNKRLTEVSVAPVEWMVDTSDIKNELANHYVRKYIDWKKFRVNIDMPLTYEKYVKDVEVQWAYGYNKVKSCLAK